METNNLTEKKEYNNYLFFHGACFDRQFDQDNFNYNDSEKSILSSDIVSLFGKFSRYCIAGKYNYENNQLELGISLLESPHPYVKKKAREIAIKHLEENKSIKIDFEKLYLWVDFERGNEVKAFNTLCFIMQDLKRGSLIGMFNTGTFKTLIDSIAFYNSRDDYFKSK